MMVNAAVMVTMSGILCSLKSIYDTGTAKALNRINLAHMML